jgi:pyridoxine 5-phosphate synthase
MSTKLSININKIALLRNSRGNNVPDILKFAMDCEAFGADGITVHPRPDERHIKYSDLHELKRIVQTELNIEGYPDEKFLQMIEEVKPHQCTLVPDAPDALTSDNGWDTIAHEHQLTEVVGRIQKQGVRVSLFINPENKYLDAAKKINTERIEFYTGPYAHLYETDRERLVLPFEEAAKHCMAIGLGVNAGHDLNLENLAFFKQKLPNLLEVSIGHAFVRDCLYYGLENVVSMYKRLLK